MPITKKSRSTPKVMAATQPVVSETNNVDIWLQRISHISQLGLFLFTIGAIYFTVLPLYQKALLDEQIARKEIELAKLQESLEKYYIKIRTNAVSSFVLQAGAECSGLMLPPHFTEPSKYKKNSELTLAIEPSACFTKILSSTRSLEELRAEDITFLKLEISRMIPTLEISRQSALKKFSRAAATVDADPSRTDPSTVSPGTVGELLFADKPIEWRRKVLRFSAIQAEESYSAESYGGDVRNALSQLRKLKWPPPN